jgi:hypothetical protein
MTTISRIGSGFVGERVGRGLISLGYAVIFDYIRDISKAKTLLGYNPNYSLKKGMQKYIGFIKVVGGLS